MLEAMPRRISATILLRLTPHCCRLYMYKAMGLESSILMERVINNAECNLNIIVRFPYYTQTLLYAKFFCEWQVIHIDRYG